MFSVNYEQVDDDSNHLTHVLDETSHKESGLISQDCNDGVSDHEEDFKDGASDREGDDFSEEINDEDYDDDDDDDYYESMLEEAEIDADHNNSNHDYYESILEEAENDADHNDSNHDYYEPSPLFEGDYRCFPLSSINKGDLEVGNKIILPANDLSPILRNQIPMPLEFEINNLSEGKISHCGVYEFSGNDKGVAFLPDWMLVNLKLKEGDFMYLKNTYLEKASYVKIQPHNSDFLKISDPKAVLEQNLQKFSCLTKGDTIEIVDGSKKLLINVLETKPDDAISVIDTDIEVDFAPPLDYKEPAKPTTASKKGQEIEATEEQAEFKPFTGIARKLGQEPYSDLGCLANKESSVTAAQSDLKNGTEKPELEPFTGIARKLGEEPQSDLGRLTKSATAAIRRMEGAEEKGISNSNSQPRNKGKEVTTENVEAENKPKFQPFTGKKYTLAGCSSSTYP